MTHRRPKKVPPFQQITEFEGESPCARHGHTMVIDERAGGTLIIFGGCNDQGQFCKDLHFFNIETRTFTCLLAHETPGTPSGRQFHSAVLHDDWMYIFGGNSNGYYNDLHRFHLDLLKWEEVLPRSDPSQAPTPRAGHSTVIYDRQMYLFGGYDKHGMSCNDLFSFHFESRVWRRMTRKGIIPRDVFHHVAVVHQGSMYIIGGRDALDQTRQMTSTANPPSSSSQGLPSLLSGPQLSSSSSLGQASSLISGVPSSSSSSSSSPAASLALSPTSVLSSAVQSSPIISAVSSSAGSMTGSIDLHRVTNKSTTIIEYRFGTGTWSLVIDHGSPPRRLWGQKAVVFDDCMYVFGGRDSTGNTDEMFEFHFPTQEWKKTDCEGCGMGISPRSFCVVGVCDQTMYVFGGRNIYNFCFNDLFQCNLVTKGSTCTIKDNFRALLNDATLSDVVFSFPSEKNRDIYAHRNILAMRCAPFNAMFQSEMKEGRTGEIVITNINYEAFYSLLEYLYTGDLVCKPRDLMAVLQSADLYQLDHLKYICERKLQRFVDQENAVYLFQMADKFKASTLKQFCLKFVCKYHSTLQFSEQYQTLEPDLHSEIIRAMSSD